MIVGVCRIVLALPGNDSLKGKRAVVKSVLSRARNRFQVSAAEIEDQDVHRRACLGFALVTSDARHARSVLDKVLAFVAGASEAELVEHAIRVEHLDLEAGSAALSAGFVPFDDTDDEVYDDFVDEEDLEDDDGGEEG
jgi:uncharacterized protein YlxP (DUF503 family)